MKIKFFLLAIFCTLLVNVHLKALFSIRIKSIKYYCNPKYFNYCMGKLRAVRGKLGILDGYCSIKTTIDNVLADGVIYYRYGTIYHTYLIDYHKVDCCPLFKNDTPYVNHPIRLLLGKAIKKIYPRFLRGCPFTGQWNLTNFDANATVTEFFPPILPRGTYKLVGRAYTRENETIGTGEILVELIPNHDSRAFDFSMLGMG